MKGRKERRKRGRSLTCPHPNNRGFVLKQTNTLNLGIKLSLVLSMIWLPHDICCPCRGSYERQTPDFSLSKMWQTRLLELKQLKQRPMPGALD